MLYRRLVQPAKNHSFFLFGARATGKSTFVRSLFPPETSLHIDLLLPAVEERFARRPDDILAEIKGLDSRIRWILLDEVQKVPKLLDVVHHVIESKVVNLHFVLTGSSGRKLKRGSANLLAGRAFVYNLFPLTPDELGQDFDLDNALAWGTLPPIYAIAEEQNKREFLLAYVRTYISEEIQKEQIVRNIDPFRHFLEVAAQHDGKIINSSSLSRGIGVDPKTITSYYQILEDTLVGSFLLPFSFSFRKKLLKSPKFYFFDTGVSRAMARLSGVPLTAATSHYGDVFEQFLVNQVKAYNAYLRKDFRLSYYHDENNIQVDLVIERPGEPILFVELKSASSVTREMTKNLRTVRKDFSEALFELWSRDPIAKEIDGVRCLPWMQGLTQLFQPGARFV